MTERDEIVPNRDPGRKAFGVVGLAFAALAVLCIPLGCPTLLVTWYANAPLALVGLVCGAFSRGGGCGSQRWS